MGIDATVTDQPITDELAMSADVFVLQSTVDKQGIALLRAYQKEKGKKIVAEFDDFFDANEDNPNLLEHQISQAPDVLRVVAEIADVVTCTTNHLADKLRPYNKNVVVLPNFMDMERWDLPKKPNKTGYINIGWCGGMSHYKDLEMIVEPLQRILKEFSNVKLFIVGELRAKKWFEGYKNVECMLAVPFEAYPTRLHGLSLDIGLAPLIDNEFNKCKTNIKWMEYSIAQIAGVFSPTVYNRRGFEPKFGFIAKTPDEWYSAIKQLILHPDIRKEAAINSYDLVKHNYNLQKQVHKWAETYTNLFV